MGTWSTFYTYLQKIYVLTRTFHWWCTNIPSWKWIGDDDLSQQKLKAVLGSVTTGWYPVFLFFLFRSMILMCRLLRFWWSHELAVPHLIETCHLFTYFVAQQNQAQTCLLLQVTFESTICLAWRLSHLYSVCWSFANDPLLPDQFLHSPSIHSVP